MINIIYSIHTSTRRVLLLFVSNSPSLPPTVLLLTHLHRAAAAVHPATSPLPAIPTPFFVASTTSRLQHHQTQLANSSSLVSAAATSVLVVYRHCYYCKPPYIPSGSPSGHPVACTTKEALLVKSTTKTTPMIMISRGENPHLISIPLLKYFPVLFQESILRVVLRLASQLKGTMDQGHIDKLVVTSDISAFKTFYYVCFSIGVVNCTVT